MGKVVKQHEAWQGAAARFLARRFPGGGAWDLAGFEHGTKSTIFLARRAEGSPARCVTRIFGEPKAWMRYSEKSRAMEQYGLSAPRRLAASGRWEPMLRREPWIFVENFLDGPLLCDVEPGVELARDFGGSLGRMHAIHGPGYGWGRRLPPPAQYHERCLDLLNRRWEELIADLGRQGLKLPPGLEEGVMGLKEKLGRWRFSGPFCLVHGELGPDDMIWLPAQREVAFIDLAAMRFNHRHFDLLRARQRFAHADATAAEGGDAGRLAAFDKAYWAAAGAEHLAGAEADEPFIGGLLDVMRMQTRVREMRRHPERKDEFYAALNKAASRLAARPLG